MKTIKIIKTKEIIYKCDECGFIFDRSDNISYNNHYKSLEWETWYYEEDIYLCGKCVLMMIKYYKNKK